MVTKLTIVTVLKGIMMAATNGCRFPVMANDNPTTLYKSDNAKLILIVVMDFWDNFKK